VSVEPGPGATDYGLGERLGLGLTPPPDVGVTNGVVADGVGEGVMEGDGVTLGTMAVPT
jgi:hypothetical protein